LDLDRVGGMQLGEALRTNKLKCARTILAHVGQQRERMSRRLETPRPGFEYLRAIRKQTRQERLDEPVCMNWLNEWQRQ
jgi:hypothetical protein